MKSERLMNERRLALLKTIRKENQSLRRYMNDIINEMENPESAFNTGKMTQSTDLDRTTAIRLCDAFAVAKMYSEKNHLDFPELIEFVSEKTLEILADGKITLTAPFKERMKFLIRQQFPFRNPLLSRSGRRNMLSYELADKEIWGDSINEDENSQNDDNLMLETPILFTNNANNAYSEMEHDLEVKDVRERVERVLKSLSSQEEAVIRWRFGFADESPRTLEEVGKILGLSRARIGQIEAQTRRNLHSRRYLMVLGNLLYDDEKYYSSVKRGSPIKMTFISKPINNFETIVYWQPFCICKYQMRYRKLVFIQNKWKWAFCCQNCGKIYLVKHEKLKLVEGYALKGYSSNNPYDKSRWPMFHWDKTEQTDFDRGFKRLKIKYDVQYYAKQLQQYYGDDYKLIKEKKSEIIDIYELAGKNIISIESAYEKCRNILMNKDSANRKAEEGSEIL